MGLKANADAVWTVSALNFEIRTLLEKGVGSIWIEGEVSNFAQPSSGHWYFSLKDERAQLRAAMFKNRNSRVAFTPQNGQQVLARAQVTLYEARGDFQIIVEHLEEAGTGLLMRRYEALKKELADEGLFADSAKQSVPSRASHIGIITSATGAALRDVLSVIRRRSPGSQVTLFPTQVQGESATAQIVQAIEQANRFDACDVLLLVRGGGSLEDLWCFNEEAVARAIFASNCPVVTGIGHEIDFTIADFVADLRAPTPSVAAESVTMDQFEVMMSFDRLQERLQRVMQQRRLADHDRLQQSLHRLLALHPRRQMDQSRQRLEFAIERMRSLEVGRRQMQLARLLLLDERLLHHDPRPRITAARERIENQLRLLSQAVTHRLKQNRHRLSLQARSLDNLSPLQTLARGYATVSRSGRLVTAARDLSAGDEVAIRFADGEKPARIE